MGKIYAMGDTHGDWRKVNALCEDMTEQDIVIHVGDHGVNFYGNGRDNHLKNKMQKMKPTFILISGNHDRPVADYNYEKIDIENEIIKGQFYYEPNYPKILHCPLISEFFISEKKFLTFGGAYSIDKDFRLKMGWHWFVKEQIPQDQMDKFKKTNKGISTDYIISHTCPKKYEPTHLFLPFIDQSGVDKRTEEFLNWVDENINYKQWYFGHFHANEQLWDKGYMLFENIKEISEF